MRTAAFAMLTVTLLSPLPVSGRQDHSTPSVSLHMAALVGNIEAIQHHIRAGSDLDEKDPYGSTALIIAATFGETEVARALIEAGADLTITNNEEATPLPVAALFCRPEIVEALLDHGADKHVRDNAGNTPFLSVAAPFDDVKGIYDLFSQGLAPLGLAPTLVAEIYHDAAEMENLYGLLVVKNGHLVAEGYFNEGSVERKELLQSATKSFTSALVGIALDQGCLSSVDQKMMDFFPEIAGQITDPRKKQITIRDMLQMRAGYPWEETDPALWEALLTGDYLPLIDDFQLTGDPGAEFHYSNLTSHWLGVIVARACDTDLRSFGQEHLFSPIYAEVGEWMQDKDGYYIGGAEIHSTARDAAKFGLLYLNDGEYEGKQIISASWVEESLQTYSEGMYDSEWQGEETNYLGPYFRDVGYGYQWWSARVGDHDIDFAWGHGGQLIVLLDELDMVVVVTSDPFHIQHDDESWRNERANINLVGKFISSLPAG